MNGKITERDRFHQEFCKTIAEFSTHTAQDIRHCLDRIIEIDKIWLEREKYRQCLQVIAKGEVPQGLDARPLGATGMKFLARKALDGKWKLKE